MKVTVICFSSSSDKYFKENLSLPVAVFDGIFLTNFNFDNLFVFDLSCISLNTKNLILLTDEILIPFLSSFVRTATFFCSVVSLLYVVKSIQTIFVSILFLMLKCRYLKLSISSALKFSRYVLILKENVLKK